MSEIIFSFEDENLHEPILRSLKANGIQFSQLELLRYSVNKNYKVTSNDGNFFLRVYRPNKESREQVLAEHEFLVFLSQNGLKVAAPKTLANGTSLGEMQTLSGHTLRFALFDFLPGAHPTDLSFFSFDWGRRLGQLHDLSRRYSKIRKNYERRSWEQASWVLKSEELLKKIIPETQHSLFLNEHNRTLQYLNQLSSSVEEFGLIHYDFHQGNILGHGGDVHILDFDDCCKSWYIWDFAMPMHRLGGAHMSQQGQELKAKFIQGYREMSSLSVEWENRIRIFERIRHLYMLCWLAERATEKKWKDILPRYIRAHGEYLVANPEFEEL